MELFCFWHLVCIYQFSINLLNFLKMKKTILAVAFMAVAMVSCQDKTKDKVEDATEAVGTEIEATTEAAGDAIDSTATEVAEDAKEAVEAGAEKVEETAKEVKDAAKK
jgi:hypothetical protein